MHLSYEPNASLEFQFSVEPHTPERKAAIDAMRNWSADEGTSQIRIGTSRVHEFKFLLWNYVPN